MESNGEEVSEEKPIDQAPESSAFAGAGDGMTTGKGNFSENRPEVGGSAGGEQVGDKQELLGDEKVTTTETKTELVRHESAEVQDQDTAATPSVNTAEGKGGPEGTTTTDVDTLAENKKNTMKQAGDKNDSLISVEIREKINPDEINPYDSISNIRSYPDRSSKDTTIVNKTANISKGETKQQHDNIKPPSSQINASPTKAPKKMKKGIFISYSPDAGFLERKFVVETVRQLKENNLAEDIWFDKDEKNTDSPCWFSLRMEAVERCRAAILVLSDSYFMCPVSVYEGKVLLDRLRSDPGCVRVYLVLFSKLENTEIPKQYDRLLNNLVDLTDPSHSKVSLAEKTSVVIGSIMESLEKFASINTPPTPTTPPDAEFTGNYKKKKICQWSVNDLQEWLFKLGIKEFYRQSLAEQMVDGFLLMSLTDHDMIHHLGIDSRVVRKKIMQQILQTLDKEHKQADNWHLRARAQRPKTDLVYLIYDPADVRLAQNMKADLRRKNVQVIHHDSLRLGKSKEEFLQINGPNIATATNVIVIKTEATTSSPFVFQEVMFADWLGKKLVTALFKNTWGTMRPSLKAVLGECPAVDFETKMYAESLDVLEHHIKPLRRVPGVVLEQAYLNKMADGLKPLEILACSKIPADIPLWSSDDDPKVFISYQWDMQDRVEEIKQTLEKYGFSCWADIQMTQRGHSSMSCRSSLSHLDTHSESLQGQIQRSMKTACLVLSCVTPKYLQSDSCAKDLSLADSLNKPILPVLLRFSPTEGAPPQVRKILAKVSFMDLSNDRLFRQNLPHLVERVYKMISSDVNS